MFALCIQTTFNESTTTAADMTTRCAFKIEDPFRGPGRVHFGAPDEEFGLEGTPKPKIQGGLPPQKGNLICSTPLYGIELLVVVVVVDEVPMNWALLEVS